MTGIKKTYRFYTTLAACCIAACFLLTGCKDEKSTKKVSDKLLLGGNDKSPMGAYLMKYMAEKSFVDIEIKNNNLTFDKWYKNNYGYDESRQVYFIIAPRLLTYKAEATAMADFVSEGNTMFIAANYFDPYFLEQFAVSLHDDISILSPPSAFRMRDTQVKLVDSTLFNPLSFSFFFYPMEKSLGTDSSKFFEVIGRNDFGNPDLLRIKHGRGELIIMSNVQALTNYFLLTHNNHNYALGALSYLPTEPETVVWDDFYRRHASRRPEGKTMFDALFSIPSLKYTFWIVLVMAALWLATNLTRRQRVIPVIKPNINSSAEFTQTIARLYFNKKDNHNIALKMITYMQDHIRNKYFVNYNSAKEDFAAILAAKTGLPPERLQSLADLVHTVQHNATTDDITLLKLNEQIQEVMNVK